MFIRARKGYTNSFSSVSLKGTSGFLTEQDRMRKGFSSVLRMVWEPPDASQFFYISCVLKSWNFRFKWLDDEEVRDREQSQMV